MCFSAFKSWVLYYEAGFAVNEAFRVWLWVCGSVSEVHAANPFWSRLCRDNRSMRIKASPTDQSIPFVWIPGSWIVTRARVFIVRLNPFLWSMRNIDSQWRGLRSGLFILFPAHFEQFQSNFIFYRPLCCDVESWNRHRRSLVLVDLLRFALSLLTGLNSVFIQMRPI